MLRTDLLGYNSRMLNPTQVLAFLTHPDTDVRQLAAEYLADLGDTAPVETADELWHAIDRFGEQRTELGTKQRQRFLLALETVPQNESTITHAISLLGSCGSDPDCIFAVNQVLQQMPLDLLKARREEILPLAKPESRAWLEHRLSLCLLPAEELWQQFEILAEKAENAEESKEIDSHAATRLVEALSKHPDFAIPLATAVLEKPGERWWLETWCVELLGRLRHAPAIDLLVEKLKTEDADILQQTAGEALGRMDAGTVVPKLEAAYASDDPFHRMTVAESLAKIKHHLAEDALIRLLGDEDNDSATTGLCTALCDLCTTEGLEPLRQVVIADRYDGTIADVKELLVTVAKMTGFEPPELQEWKAQLVDPVYKKQRRDNFLASFGMNEKMVDLFQKYLKTNPLALDEAEEPAAPAAQLPPPQATLPYRREGPKVGRNDPCPCGSGKKYKKCCGA